MATSKKSEKLQEETLPEEEVVAEAPVLKQEKVSDEVLFLEKLYRIQNDGGFGIHLNELIKERITYLNNK